MTPMKEKVTVVKCDICSNEGAVTVRVTPEGAGDGFTVDLCPKHMAPIRELEKAGTPVIRKTRRSNNRRVIHEAAPAKPAAPKRQVNLTPKKP